MLFTNKKTIICLAAAAVMSMGGITAFASAPETALTPAANVDVSKINAQEGEYIVAGTIDPKILNNLKNAETASGLTLTAMPGSFDTTDVQKGECKIIKAIDSKTLSGTGKTAPNPAYQDKN